MQREAARGSDCIGGSDSELLTGPETATAAVTAAVAGSVTASAAVAVSDSVSATVRGARCCGRCRRLAIRRQTGRYRARSEDACTRRANLWMDATLASIVVQAGLLGSPACSSVRFSAIHALTTCKALRPVALSKEWRTVLPSMATSLPVEQSVEHCQVVGLN